MTSQINQRELSAQYDKMGEEYLAARTAFYQKLDDGAKKFIDDELKKRIESPTGLKLLDVGCGDCGDLRNVSDMGFNVYGLDQSSLMLSKAVLHWFNPQRLFLASMDKIPIQNESFDVITGRYSLHYLENVDAAYSEFARVLKPEGLLVLVVGHPLNNLLRQKNKTYGQKEVIEVPLYGEKTTVKSVSHTIGDYLSPTYLANFDLLRVEEGTQMNERGFEGFQTPGFFGFVGRKR